MTNKVATICLYCGETLPVEEQGNFCGQQCEDYFYGRYYEHPAGIRHTNNASAIMRTQHEYHGGYTE